MEIIFYKYLQSLKVFVDKLEQYSFSAGGYLPTIKSTCNQAFFQ